MIITLCLMRMSDFQFGIFTLSGLSTNIASLSAKLKILYIRLLSVSENTDREKTKHDKKNDHPDFARSPTNGRSSKTNKPF